MGDTGGPTPQGVVRPLDVEGPGWQAEQAGGVVSQQHSSHGTLGGLCFTVEEKPVAAAVPASRFLPPGSCLAWLPVLTFLDYKM